MVNGNLLVRERGIRFPIESIGGGNQEALRLLYELTGKNKIFCVEEPELHLHAELARRLFKQFKEVSQKNQMFLTTHSNIFVDQSSFDNIWLVRLTDGTTLAHPITETKFLKEINYELGIRPSDIFFANSILFVEGETEIRVIPKWAELLGIEMSPPNVALIPLRGSGKGKYHLSMWTEIAKHVSVPFFLLLDSDAKRERNEVLKKKLLTEEQIHILQLGSIEDYYPEDLLFEALKPLLKPQDNMIPKIEAAIKKRPRAREIDKIAKKKRNIHLSSQWKVPAGEYVTNKMKRDQLNDEIITVLTKISVELALGS